MVPQAISFDRPFETLTRSEQTDVQEHELSAKRAGRSLLCFAGSLWAFVGLFALAVLTPGEHRFHMALFLFMSAPTVAAVHSGQLWSSEVNNANAIRARLLRRAALRR